MHFFFTSKLQTSHFFSHEFVADETSAEVVFFLWRVNAWRRCHRCRMQNVTALRWEQAEDFTLPEIASSPRCRAAVFFAERAVERGDNWEDYGWFTVKSLLLLKDFTVSLRCRPASHLCVKRMIAWFDMSQKSRTKLLPWIFFSSGVSAVQLPGCFGERVINNCWSLWAAVSSEEHTQWNMSNKWTK